MKTNDEAIYNLLSLTLGNNNSGLMISKILHKYFSILYWLMVIQLIKRKYLTKQLKPMIQISSKFLRSESNKPGSNGEITSFRLSR